MSRAALAAALVVLLAPAPASAAAIRLSATLTPRAVLFGDQVQAQVDVVVDPRVVDPAQIELTTPLGAWTESGATVARTTRAGRLVRRSFRLTIVCRTAACVPAGVSQLVTLPAATVIAHRRDGRTVRGRVAWPHLTVASRLPAGAAAAARPPFELQVAPPAAQPRVSSTVAAWLLGAGAAVLAALAAGCAVVEVRRRRVRAAAPVDPLARALALAREAESRPPADRRRALALLARVVPRPDDGGVASAAATTAWSAAEPSAGEVAELVARLEEPERS